MEYNSVESLLAAHGLTATSHVVYPDSPGAYDYRCVSGSVMLSQGFGRTERQVEDYAEKVFSKPLP